MNFEPGCLREYVLDGELHEVFDSQDEVNIIPYNLGIVLLVRVFVSFELLFEIDEIRYPIRIKHDHKGLRG